MSLRRMIGAGLLLLAAALPAAAQSGLEWKFKEGDKFVIESSTETKQTITKDEKPTTSESTFTTVSTFVVKKAAAGSYTLEQTIDEVRVKSNKPDDPTVAIASRYANQLKGATFKFNLSPSGKITSSGTASGLEGYEDLIKKLTGGNEQAAKAARTVYPEDAFKEELNNIFGFLPDKASPEEGYTWTRKESMAMPWGKLTGEATYKYLGKKKDGEEFDVTRRWTYALPDENIQGVKVTKGDLKVTDATTKIVADPSAGRLVSLKQTMRLAGKVTVTTTETPPKDITADVDQTTTRTIKRVEATAPK
jgi:hypothetical protein